MINVVSLICADDRIGLLGLRANARLRAATADNRPSIDGTGQKSSGRTGASCMSCRSEARSTCEDGSTWAIPAIRVGGEALDCKKFGTPRRRAGTSE